MSNQFNTHSNDSTKSTRKNTHASFDVYKGVDVLEDAFIFEAHCNIESIDVDTFIKATIMFDKEAIITAKENGYFRPDIVAHLITMLRYRYKSYIDPLHHSSVTDSSIYPSDQKFPFQKIEKLTNRYISNRIEADPKSYSEQKTKSDTTLVCGVSLNEFSKKFIADYYNNDNQNKMDCFEKEEINRLDTKLNFYGLINLYKRCKGQSSTSYGNYYKEILCMIFTTKIGGHKPESFVTDLLGLIISGIENVKFKYRMIRSFDKARDIFVKNTLQHPHSRVDAKVSESTTSISNRNRSTWLHFPEFERIQYRLTENASQKQNQFKNVMTDVQYILQYMNQNKYSGSDEFVKKL